MKFVLIKTFLFVSILTFGQDANKVLGHVTNFENAGISYVSIYGLNGKGIISDEKGNFILEKLSDTITFKAIGFKTKKIAFSDLRTNSNVKLETKFFELSDVIIRNHRSVWLGYTSKKKTSLYYFLKPYGKSEEGIRIRRPDYVTGFLKTVKVKAGFVGSPKLPYRINIYNLNQAGMPDDNILKKDIVFVPTSKKLKWYQFSLEDQQIEMPENGVCITLEFLNPSTQEYKLDKNYSPLRAGFFSSEYNHILRTTQSSNKWYQTNTASPVISLEIVLY